MEVVRTNLVADVPIVVDTRNTRYQVQEFIYEEKKEAVAQLFLVRVGPDGEEQARVSLPLSELQDLSRLLNRLAKQSWNTRDYTRTGLREAVVVGQARVVPMM